jgi:hypothetical protein
MVIVDMYTVSTYESYKILYDSKELENEKHTDADTDELTMAGTSYPGFSSVSSGSGSTFSGSFFFSTTTGAFTAGGDSSNGASTSCTASLLPHAPIALTVLTTRFDSFAKQSLSLCGTMTARRQANATKHQPTGGRVRLKSFPSVPRTGGWYHTFNVVVRPLRIMTLIINIGYDHTISIQ